MRMAGTIVGIILILVGGLWILQGSNILVGSAMSGVSQWLYIGIAMVIVGLAALVWSYRRSR